MTVSFNSTTVAGWLDLLLRCDTVEVRKMRREVKMEEGWMDRGR